jgi:hypothetical protein
MERRRRSRFNNNQLIPGKSIFSEKEEKKRRNKWRQRMRQAAVPRKLNTS